MFRFASGLVFKVRLPKSNFESVDGRLSWSRKYACKDINLGGQEIASGDKLSPTPMDRDAVEESILPGSCASFVQQFKNPTCDLDENGIKYLPVMRQAMCIEGHKVLEAGVDVVDLKNGITRALEVIQKHLKCRARMVSTSEEIFQVGTTAANGDRKIGELIAQAMEKVGKEGAFIIYGKKKSINKIEFVNGMKLDWGAISPYLINEEDRTCVLRNSFVLIHENKISDKNIVKQACLWTDYKRPLLIVAKDVELEVGGSLFLDKTCLQAEFCIIKPPEFEENLEVDYEENLKAVYEENLKGIMQDLAILTGGRVVTMSSNCGVIPLMLGSCKEAIVRDNEMIIHGGSGVQARINKRCEQLGSAIKLSTLDYEIKLLEERLRKLSRGAAIFKVGGASKAKVHKRIKTKNSLNAAKSTIEEGIVPGAGVAFLHASKELDKLQTTSAGEKNGVQLLQYALKMPVYAIASAAGFDGSHVVRKLLEQDNKDLGFDPVTGEYVDVIKSGNIDPLKLVIKELDDLKSDLDNDSWCYSEML